MRTWVISDTHFGWANGLVFKTKEGLPLRTFPSVWEMDQTMIDRWNDVVDDKDLVYHLGDIAMRRNVLRGVVPKLKGRKKLIRGNHDIWKLEDYLPMFEDIAAVKVIPEHQVILSHYPHHPGSLYGGKINIHGHTHSNKVLLEDGTEDMRYINVCVEHTNFAPMLLDDLLAEAKRRRDNNLLPSIPERL